MRSRTLRTICAGAALLLAAVFAHAAFPKSTSSATVRTDRITGNWDSFSFKWIDLNDQQVYLTLTNASGFVSLVGYYPRARISRAGTTYVDVNTSDITITSTGVSFTIPYTNIPPPKDYDMELWAWDSSTSNQRVTLAQGKVGVSKSLYSDTNQFPFPASGTLTDYLPRNGSAAMTSNGNAGGYSWTNLGGLTFVDGSSVTTAPVTLSGLVAVSNAFRTADGALSNSLVALMDGKDSGVSNAFRSADTILSNAYVAADSGVSNAFRSADGALSNSIVANFATLSGMTAVSNVAALWPAASNNVPYLNSSSNLWTGANNRFSQRLWADSIRSGIPDVILYGSVLNLSNLTWQSEAEAGTIINLDTMTLSGGEWNTDGTELSGTYIISFLGLTNWWCTMGARDYANITNTPWTTVEATSNWVARLGPTNVAYFNTNYVTPAVAAAIYATLAGMAAVSNTFNNYYWDFIGVATNNGYPGKWGGHDEDITFLKVKFHCDATGQVTFLQKTPSEGWYSGGSTAAVLPMSSTVSTNAIWIQSTLTNGNFLQERFDGGTCTNYWFGIKWRN